MSLRDTALKYQYWLRLLIALYLEEYQLCYNTAHMLLHPVHKVSLTSCSVCVLPLSLSQRITPCVTVNTLVKLEESFPQCCDAQNSTRPARGLVGHSMQLLTSNPFTPSHPLAKAWSVCCSDSVIYHTTLLVQSGIGTGYTYLKQECSGSNQLVALIKYFSSLQGVRRGGVTPSVYH